jgi:hypothetical protein
MGLPRAARDPIPTATTNTTNDNSRHAHPPPAADAELQTPKSPYDQQIIIAAELTTDATDFGHLRRWSAGTQGVWLLAR